VRVAWQNGEPALGGMLNVLEFFERACPTSIKILNIQQGG
jgi:hypothetical protein